MPLLERGNQGKRSELDRGNYRSIHSVARSDARPRHSFLDVPGGTTRADTKNWDSVWRGRMDCGGQGTVHFPSPDKKKSLRYRREEMQGPTIERLYRKRGTSHNFLGSKPNSLSRNIRLTSWDQQKEHAKSLLEWLGVIHTVHQVQEKSPPEVRTTKGTAKGY